MITKGRDCGSAEWIKKVNEGQARPEGSSKTCLPVEGAEFNSDHDFPGKKKKKKNTLCFFNRSTSSDALLEVEEVLLPRRPANLGHQNWNSFAVLSGAPKENVTAAQIYERKSAITFITIRSKFAIAFARTQIYKSRLLVADYRACVILPPLYTTMLVVSMSQGFIVFLAFCYFACLFLAFFILYLIFESWRRSRTWKQKTQDMRVINDPLGQTHTPPVAISILAWTFCVARFEKWGRTYRQHLRKYDHYRPWLWVGLVDQLFVLFGLFFVPMPRQMIVFLWHVLQILS